MLGLLFFLSVLFLVYVVYLQGSALLETRRQSRDMQANRDLADRAEASRFTELRAFLEVELTNQNDLNAESKSSILARVDKLEHDLRTFMEESGNSLAAYIGELEERLDKREIPFSGD